MPFFENASNFTISGGTFNSISGDLNQYHEHYNAYTVNSFNNNRDDDTIGQQYYPPYGPRPSRGNFPSPSGPPSPHRPQYHHRERGPYGYADYYDNGDRAARESHEGWSSRGHLETALYAPGHVEIAGGEFNARPGRAHSQNSMQERQDDHQSTAAMDPSLHEAADQGIPAPTSSEGDMVVEEEDSEPSVDDSGSTSSPATSSGFPPSPAPKKPLTPLERMRMNLAGMNISGQEDAEVQVDAAALPSPAPPSAESKQKSFFRRVNIKS